MTKEYIEAFNEIIDKFAEQIMRANKEELTAINKTNAIEYLYRTPQVRLLQQALQRLEAIDNAKPSEAMEMLKGIEYVADVLKVNHKIGSRNIANQEIKEMVDRLNYRIPTIKQALLKAQEQEALLKTGDLSDGYHTFNQLYYQRCVLFASLVRLNKDKSWKSFKHSDGKYCFDRNGEWFIVGIDTPIGSYTYHYEKKYWDLFECQELECGKEWDGHTEEDVTRLLSLPNEQEKVLKIIKKKVFPLNNHTMIINHYKEYRSYYSAFNQFYEDVYDAEKYLLSKEEFDLLKRYFK